MTFSLKAALAAALLLAAPALAHEYKVGELTIGHPYAFPSPGRTGAGYLTITNAGDTPDTLTAVEVEGAIASIHTTTTNSAGVAKMAPVESLEVPAHGTVTLAPRAMHIMLMDLAKPLRVGDSLPATLVFEKAGEVAVDFKVDARGREAASETPEKTPDHTGH